MKKDQYALWKIKYPDWGGEGRGGEEGGERKTISKYFKKKIGLV